MTQLMWNAVGERMFEAGVDRGVLYVEGSDGVPWNGLISVAETPTGGEITPHYIDGVKYFNHVASEEFEATIEAFTYPEEFAECDGTLLVDNGLFATQQRKKTFGLAYRTMVGNDVDGPDHGYKIHLVYNTTASPTERPNNTMSDTIEPFNFLWRIVTKPSIFSGYKQTSHFIIDSRETPRDLLAGIESILYGSFTAPPRLPSVIELVSIFKNYDPSDWLIDAGWLGELYSDELDSGHISENQTTTVDGGGP